VQAPKDAPNIVLILLDDVGFGASSITGGPVHAPALEKLAKQGLLYDNFHVNALCSPTRASLLSGRNDHKIGFGIVTDAASGFPGYNAEWPRSAATIAEVLKDNGYSTAAFGKWHNTPPWEIGPGGPFDHWPNALGFEYFYGFLGGDDSQYETRLYRNTTPAEPWGTPAQGYHLTADLANDAIHWLHQHDAVEPDRPFFLYFATGATHQPHQVPQTWIDQYKGKFDQGWDKLREEIFARQKAAGIVPANAELTKRPAEIPAWDSLTPSQKQLLSHQAEVYAGFLAQTDYEVGRLLDDVRAEGHGDNTLVLYIVGDNGASAEGGLEGRDAETADGEAQPIGSRLQVINQFGSDLYFNHYAAGWAWGLDAPFQWSKQVASHLGGTTDPLVVAWPAKITAHGAVRGQFGHVTDIAPTIYQVAGITPPAQVNGVPQLPFDGVSLAATFTDANAKSNHHVQYFETIGNRGIYQDGWWAGDRHMLPWELSPAKWITTPIGNHPWELYNLNEDYSQAHDLAAANPAKLKELEDLFDSEAKRNNVYPLLPFPLGAPSLANGRTHYRFRGDVERITQLQLPNLRGKEFTLTAKVNVPQGGADGVVIADGGRYSGLALYVQHGTPVFEVSAFGNTAGRVTASDKLAPGANTIEVDVTPVSQNPLANGLLSLFNGKPLPVTAELRVNGKDEGKADIANVANIDNETLDVGKDLGSTVSAAYAGPFAFAGTIGEVTLDIK
jgi:arylsulfatase